MNKELIAGFSKVCIWQFANLSGKSPENFEEYMFDKFNVKVQFLEELVLSENKVDLLFALHDEYVDKFHDRVDFGIEWIEDIYWNNLGAYYPQRLVKYIN